MSRIVRQTKNAELMAAGVTIEDPATTYIDADVQIGADTIIHPGVSIEGGTVDRRRLRNSQRRADRRLAARRSRHRAEPLRDHRLAPRRRRVGRTVRASAQRTRRSAPGAKVGNFVELKKTALGAGSKAMHLAYLGDASIGASVNIGAGTITCNYDGTHKHTTTIEDGAFIGSDTQLIAPVTVGAGRLRRHRHDRARGRAGRRARRQRRQAAQHRGLGGAEAKKNAIRN